MVKAELGTKRTCPDTGKKFYDLNRDPIISPYTQKSWPLSYFEKTLPISEVSENDEAVEIIEKDPHVELVSLDDVGVSAVGDDLEDVGVDEIGLDEDDAFLETTDEEDADMSNIIDITPDSDES